MTLSIDRLSPEDELLPGIEPRDYQRECVEVLARARDEGEKKALIYMATGLGKTAIMALDLDQFLSEQPDARILFLSHRDEINRQTKNRFETALARYGLYGHLFKGSSIPNDLHSIPLILSTFQAMHGNDTDCGRVRELFGPYDFDYIIVDESHHSQADTYKQTIDYFQPQFMLGTTATPNRSDGKSIRQIFGPEIYTKSLADGIKEGILAQPHYVAAIPESAISELEWDILDDSTQEGKSTFIGEDIISDFLQRSSEYVDKPKTLFYCNNIEEAEEYAALLPGASAIHSELSGGERRKILDAFRNGEIRTLTSVNIMNEGIDVPDIDMIVFARSTSSETTFLQQLGRGLRRAVGKDKVYIFDYVANYERLKMLNKLIALIDSNQDDEWESDPAEKNVIDMLNEGKIVLDNAQFLFDGRVLDIAALLEKRQELQREAANWNRERSIQVYKDICRELGRVATLNDIDDYVGERDRMFILWPFRNRLIDLKRESGIKFLDQHPDMVGMSAFCSQHNINSVSFSNIIEKYSVPVTMLAIEDGRPVKSVAKRDAERMLVLMGDRISRTRKSTVIHKYNKYEEIEFEEDDLPEGYSTLNDLAKQYNWSIDRSALYVLAYEGDISIERYRTYTNTNRLKMQDAIAYDDVGRLDDLMSNIGFPDTHQKDINMLARSLNMETQTIVPLLKKANITGIPRVSPASSHISLYYDYAVAAEAIHDLLRD